MFLQLLATPLGLHLSGYQVSCSNLRMNKRRWTMPLRQRSGTSSESKTNMTEEAHSCTSLQHSWKLKKRLWDDLAPCQSLSKRLSQTFIAAILLWCDEHVPGIRNILKTGQFHPCTGSSRNWPCKSQLLVLHFAILHLASTRVEQDGPIAIRWFLVGSTCLVHGVLPILFPSYVSCIGIFCFTHRCWPVLFPAGSIRSSSPSSWYENCFKPMALQVPGSPLRPYRSTSGFSGQGRCKCWGKTGRNCIWQGHSWKLAYPLRTFASSFEGSTATSILGWWSLLH